MSPAPAIKSEQLATLDEYLALEEKSQIRHEYHAGRIYAMFGGSPAHADLSFNIAVAIGKRLGGKRCRGSSGDQRIRIEAANVSLYPDVVVKCPPERYSEQDPHALINPSLIVEVLSPSTEKYDQTSKFQLYAQIPELRDYLLVSQDRVLVQHFRRSDDGKWVLSWFNQRDQVLPLENLELEVPVAEIYEGLDVPSGLVVLDQTTVQGPNGLSTSN